VSGPSDQLRSRAHLNLVESSRRLFEFDPGARIEAGEGWLFGAGSSRHPAISNAAFRSDDGLDPTLLLARARAFFGELGRGFSLWVRDPAPEDDELAAAAEAAGLNEVYAMPEMVIGRRAEEPLQQGIELRRIGRAEEAAFIAYQDEEPVAIAMTIVSHGVAGVYWVGSVEATRGHGLGRAVTAAATNAGLDLGADVASLQASPMGESLYAAMGYETICSYRLLLSPPP